MPRPSHEEPFARFGLAARHTSSGHSLTEISDAASLRPFARALLTLALEIQERERTTREHCNYLSTGLDQRSERKGGRAGDGPSPPRSTKEVD